MEIKLKLRYYVTLTFEFSVGSLSQMVLVVQTSLYIQIIYRNNFTVGVVTLVRLTFDFQD